MSRKKQLPFDWVGLGLQLGTNVTKIIETAQPTERERMFRAEINKVKKVAKAQLKAEKLRQREFDVRIDAILDALETGRQAGLTEEQLTGIKDDLVRVLQQVGDGLI